MRRQVIGYNQALKLLEQGAKMFWHHYPSCRATIEGKTVPFNSYIKLGQLCQRISDDGNKAIYRLKALVID